MSAKIIIITAFLLLSVTNSFAALAKMPTQEQLDKYCIAVQLKIDEQIHYFAIRTIKDFNDNGFTVVYGRWGEGRNFIPKGEILNWDEVKKEYEKKKQ